MEDLILIGGGGHCKACIDVIEHTKRFNIIGILDHPDLLGNRVSGYEIIGSDLDLMAFKQCSFLVTVGHVKTNRIRKRIYDELVAKHLKLATVISPEAYVSKYAVIGKGSIIMHFAFVNNAVQIGDNCIINTSAMIEHDSTIGNHNHISTSAIVNGNCLIADDVFVGSNATIANQISITDGTIIGAGAVVVTNISNNGIYIGNPAKKKK